MNVPKGRTLLLAALSLAIFVLLLARLGHQSWTLEPLTGSGDRYIQIRGRIPSNTAASHTIISRGSPLETVNTDSAVQHLSRRGHADEASDHEFSDTGSMQSLDDETWKTQEDDGQEGQDLDKIEQDW
jgi:hypothetical protein